MEKKNLDEFIQKIPEILKTPYHDKGAEYHVWIFDDFVLKAPFPVKDKGEIIKKPKDPRETTKAFDEIKKVQPPVFKIPFTDYNGEHNVLVQQKIEGSVLQKDNSRDKTEFTRLMKQFDEGKIAIELSTGRLRPQMRNIIRDPEGEYWLIDPD